MQPPPAKAAAKNSQRIATEEDDMEIAMQMIREAKLKSPVEEKGFDDIAAPSCGKTDFRSREQLPPITHTNLASFVLENSTGRFAANTAIVDGASGAHYSYTQVGGLYSRSSGRELPIQPILLRSFLSKHNTDISRDVCVCGVQMREWVKRTAAGLVVLGVKPRDVVLMLSPNSPEFAVVYLAIVSLGAIAAPSNPLNTEADVAKQLRQADVKFVVTVPELLSKLGHSCNLPTVLIGKIYFQFRKVSPKA